MVLELVYLTWYQNAERTSEALRAVLELVYLTWYQNFMLS